MDTLGTRPGAASSSGCALFRLISASVKDTPQTKREILAHNKIFKNRCG